MTSDRRKSVEELFQRAVELPAAERSAWIDERCNDSHIRREVEALLAQDDANSTDDFESVFEVLSADLGSMSQISLRDVLGDETPIALKPGGKPELPERVGRYHVSGEIARGGVGSVWKARDVELGREIALKVLLDRHEGNPDATRRFVEEAQIGAQLQHPGIVPVHEMGVVGGKKPFFAMKLVKGETLSSLLANRNDPTQDRQHFLGIFEQICQPLAYAHARGVIHRDLKPSNVMVGAFGEVQVMDWGLAKVLSRGGPKDDERATKAAALISVIETVRSGSTGSDSITGSVMGTPAYMPPEQARGEVEDLDERSDVFGLGAILCEILTGKPPYDAASREEILRQARKGYLEDACERVDRSGADAEVIGLTKRCIARDPHDRPRSAGAVATEISKYLESLEERARWVEVRAARTRLKATLAVTGLLVLLGVVGVAGWFELDRRERVREATLAVGAALLDAQARAEAARAAGTTDLSKWDVAFEAIRRAESLISEQVEEDIATAVRELASDITRDAKNQRLLARLEEIGDESVVGAFFIRVSDYAAAFREYLGVELEGLEPDVAAGIFRDAGIHKEVALVIEEWALGLTTNSGNSGNGGDSARRLEHIALAVDPDPWRVSAKQAVTAMNVAELERLLPAAERNRAVAAFLGTLAALSSSQYGPEATVAERVQCRRTATRIYRAALELDRTSFRCNFGLGHSFLFGEPARPDAAARCFAAATALRPDHVDSWHKLAVALEALGDLPAALEAHTESVLVESTSINLASKWTRDFAFANLAELLKRDDVSGFGPALDRLIARISERLDSDTPVEPRLREILGLAWDRRPEPFRATQLRGIATREVERTGRQEPHALALLAGAEFGAGERGRAVELLEEAVDLPDAPSRLRERLAHYRNAIAPALLTYGSIDAALEAPDVLVPHGARWRFFRGTREPSPGRALDWTRPEFEDHIWEEGESGFGYGDSHAATTLDDMQGSYTTVYLRRTFRIPEKEHYRRILASVVADDGGVAYLNGAEIGRGNVASGVVPFDAVAVGPIPEPLVPFQLELRGSDLASGENLLAVQIVNISLTSSDFVGAVEIVGELSPQGLVERARRRLEEFRFRAGDGSALRVEYFEGRVLELTGDVGRAAEKFREVAEKDPERPEPWSRLARCLRSTGDHVGAERALRRLLGADRSASREIWGRWLIVSLTDLEQSPAAVLRSFPGRDEGTPPSRRGYADDFRRLLETLANGEVVRINCGGGRYESVDGNVWSRDMFHTAGNSSRLLRARDIGATDDDRLYATVRSFTEEQEGYRIPLPRGRYRVTLHFAEVAFGQVGLRVFGARLEDQTVLEGYDIFARAGINTPDVQAFDVEVDDGMLDIEFVEVESGYPMISAIEIERLE